MTRPPPMAARVAAAAALGAAAAVLGSCNPYDTVVHDHFEQSSFNSDVDILWVTDSSSSMSDTHAEIQTHFGAFINQFANVESGQGQEIEYVTVTDATVAWAEFLLNQERFLNYHMGVTTTELGAPGNGRQGNVRNLGPIGGGTDDCPEPTVLTPRYEQQTGQSLIEDFTTLIDVGTDGSGTEFGLLTAAFSMCKGMPSELWDSLAERPDDDPVKVICSQVPADHRNCNASFYRQDAAAVFIIVSDEGDMSYGSEQFPPPAWVSQCVLDHNEDPFYDECDCRLSWFLDFFDAMGRAVVFAAIAPTYQEWDEERPTVLCDGSEVVYPGPCNPHTASLCALDFYQQSACLTGGLYTPLEVRNVPPNFENGQPNPDSVCSTADFDAALGSIGALVSNLGRAWRLSVTPDVDSIRVLRTGLNRLSHEREEFVEVPRLLDAPSGGWRYLPQERAIAFSGDQVPGYDTIIDVYYLPQFETGTQIDRNLPF